MIVPCVCKDEIAIRRVLLLHEHELVSENQEVLIAWTKTQEVPVHATLKGYEPPGLGEYADMLGVSLGEGVVHLITPSQITYFEILPTKRMTSKLAYQQMKEMERAAGFGS